MAVESYIEQLKTRFKAGISTEHSYRGDLQNFLQELCPDLLVTNEPSHISCGAPDYILTKRGIPVGYIEAKDLGANLDDKAYKEQFDRYKTSLPNLIITNYLEFRLFRNGELTTSVSIGRVDGTKVLELPANYEGFTGFIKDFGTHVSQTIRSAEKLSKMMAGKARLLASVIEKALSEDESTAKKDYIRENQSLHDQFQVFKKVLLHDLTIKEFSDIYAQTIAYGMFAARLHDPTLETFTRHEAAELIPQTNPFLRKLFQSIAGYDLDSRIAWIIDDLADVFRASDVASILKNFGKSTRQHDPIIHFYETFLGEYDPKLRKSKGVYYTPTPVVNFIVRAVDDILKTEFGLKEGISDTSKVRIKVKADGKEVEKEVHKVQILDPATGTGTFLAETIKHIHQKFEGQEGIWSSYVDQHLIPRLNGFEILMASYAMAHLKLDLLLAETGYKKGNDQRFNIFLTNSLEESHPDADTLFTNWLSIEANEANKVKKETPVMVVIGNPPYSISSSNKGKWIQDLIADYKKDLNEKKLNLDDDYIKFIRFGEYLIEKNGEGVLAYISNNSFIDGITHRQMRKHLLETFDKIYILDLHGNAKKKETCPDGSKDENVFDIMQGVSINLFLKKKLDSQSGVFAARFFERYGKRQDKYDFLSNSSCSSVEWEKLEPSSPNFFLVPSAESTSFENEHESSFSIRTLFPVNNNGLKTDRDALFLDYDSQVLESRIKELLSGQLTLEFITKYGVKDSGSYKITSIIKGQCYHPEYLHRVQYRPFDDRWIYYDPSIVSRPAKQVMKHFFQRNNVGIILPRQVPVSEKSGALVNNLLAGHKAFSAYNINTVFPLYLYPEKAEGIHGKQEREPNLNMEIVNAIASKLRLTFTPEKEQTEGTFAPIDLLDYIYAVLHSPTYREKYKEFLKIDFPRVPYPEGKETFWALVKLGGELRQIHLLESLEVEKFITSYPKDGSNLVEKLKYEGGKVWINENQYFDKVPEVAWSFFIGGYQPAQKWLKDRKSRTLSFEDIRHYQKIIVALTLTDKVMQEIDKTAKF
jgi:predicted helicase